MDIKAPMMFPVGWIGYIGKKMYKIVELPNLKIGNNRATFKKAVLVRES